MEKLPRMYRLFLEEYGDVAAAYQQLGAAAAERGPLNPIIRQLIKLAIAAALGNESAVHSHVHRGLELAITPEELEHTVLLGVTSMGFPRMMTALTWVKAAVEAHE